MAGIKKLCFFFNVGYPMAISPVETMVSHSGPPDFGRFMATFTQMFQHVSTKFASSVDCNCMDYIKLYIYICIFHHMPGPGCIPSSANYGKTNCQFLATTIIMPGHN